MSSVRTGFSAGGSSRKLLSPTPWGLLGALLIPALVALTQPAKALERNFAGSAQLDYAFVPTAKNATAFPGAFDGFTMEFAGKLAVDFSEKVSANLKACYGCHGFEADMMYFDVRIAAGERGPANSPAAGCTATRRSGFAAGRCDSAPGRADGGSCRIHVRSRRA